MAKLGSAALWVQSVYYIVSGSVPIVSMRFFEAVTGPKTDDWLVRMVALLAVVIGITLGVAAKHRRWTPEVRILSVGSALAFTTIDVVYALSGRISRIYLADAVVELIIVLAIVLAGLGNRKETA